MEGRGGEGYRERGSVLDLLELSRRTLQSTIIRRQAEWCISSANLPPLGDERFLNVNVLVVRGCGEGAEELRST